VVLWVWRTSLYAEGFHQIFGKFDKGIYMRAQISNWIFKKIILDN